MRLVAFIDDDDSIATRTIAGLKVYKPKHIQQMIDLTGATQVLLAMPSERARGGVKCWLGQTVSTAM